MKFEEELAIRGEDVQVSEIVALLDSRIWVLTGKWESGIRHSQILVSDVVFSAPLRYYGFRGVIHPDDLPGVRDAVEAISEGRHSSLSMRVISTYGEVLELHGTELTLRGDVSDDLQDIHQGLFQIEFEQRRLQQQIEAFTLRMQCADQSERFSQAGSWYFDTSMNEMYISDNLYRLYGLPVQGLNGHFKTFDPFLHPDDRNAVVDAMEQSLRSFIPVHLEFRIIRADQQVRTFGVITHWNYTANGNHILYGVVHDLTDINSRENQAQSVADNYELQRQILRFEDNWSNCGHLFINLLTRKSHVSENAYRIFGLRPQAFPPDLNFFLSLIHPDDYARVQEAYRRIRREHIAPNLEFRIVRSDGKTRFIRQSSKIEAFAGTELMMISVIQDVTVVRVLESRQSEMEMRTKSIQLMCNQVEQLTDSCSFLLELESNKITWSENFLQKFNLKQHKAPTAIEGLVKFIHPADISKFNEQFELALSKQQVQPFETRFLLKGELCFFRVSLQHSESVGAALLIGALADTTAAHQSDEALTESQQLIRFLDENVPDRVFITDLNHGVQYWNKSCEKINGLRKEEAIGQNFFDLFPHWKDEQMVKRLDEVLEGCPIHDYGVSVYQGNFDIHMMPLRSMEGSYVGIMHIIRDVTEDIKTRDKLSERLLFIENMVESTIDSVVVFDRDMNYLYWNKRSEQIFGLSKETVIGQNVLNIFPVLQDHPGFEDFRQALRGETVHLLPEEREGQENFFETYLTPIKDDKGRVSAILWITRDHTNERRLTRQQKAAYQIIDSLEEACLQLDLEQRISFINKKAAELLKVKSEEVFGRPIWEAVPHFQDSAFYFAVNYAHEVKTVVQKEIYCEQLGRWIFLAANNSDEGLIVLFFDIHDRMETEEKLIREHRSLVEAQQLAQIGSFEFEPSTGKINCSEQMLAILDLREVGELEFSQFLRAFGPEGERFVQNKFESAIETGSDFEFRVSIPTSLGEKIVYGKGNVSYSKSGEPILLHGIVHDITKRVLVEGELVKLNLELREKNSELEDKNEEITNFAFIASHDLKEPLRKILTFADLLRRRDVKNNEKSDYYLDKIETAARRIGYLLTDIHELTRVHSDTGNMAPVDLNELLRAVLFDLDAKIQEFGARVIVHELPTITADAGQLQLLFRNLVSNALKFHDGQKTPEIEIRAISPLGKANLSDKEYIKIRVSDNGVGFDNKYRLKIFKIFQRLHTQSDFSGTGIGLAICKKIMQNHKGKISAESEPGKGSHFCCYFPS